MAKNTVAPIGATPRESLSDTSSVAPDTTPRYRFRSYRLNGKMEKPWLADKAMKKTRLNNIIVAVLLVAGLAAAGGDASALRQGMELTLRQLLKVAGDNGLVAVDPTGQPFNHEHHQAMSMVPAAGVAPNHVVQVYQKGWLLNERLLRPALVVVAQD